MAREIKFRLWEKTEGRMIDVSTMSMDAFNICMINDILFKGKRTFKNAKKTYEYEPMLSTGIQATFEGDIVNVYDTNRYCICSEWEDCDGEGDEEHSNHGEHRHEKSTDCDMFLCTQEVKWSSEGGYFCTEDTGEYCPPLGVEYINLEIIGNIYENPELLSRA